MSSRGIKANNKHSSQDDDRNSNGTIQQSSSFRTLNVLLMNNQLQMKDGDLNMGDEHKSSNKAISQDVETYYASSRVQEVKSGSGKDKSNVKLAMMERQIEGLVNVVAVSHCNNNEKTMCKGLSRLERDTLTKQRVMTNPQKSLLLKQRVTKPESEYSNRDDQEMVSRGETETPNDLTHSALTLRELQTLAKSSLNSIKKPNQKVNSIITGMTPEDSMNNQLRPPLNLQELQILAERSLDSNKNVDDSLSPSTIVGAASTNRDTTSRSRISLERKESKMLDLTDDDYSADVCSTVSFCHSSPTKVKTRDSTDGYGSDTEKGISQEFFASTGDCSLAVAVPVTDDDDANGIFRPSAVEFDADAKNSIKVLRQQRLRRRLFLFLVFMIVMLSIIGFVLGFMVKTNDGNDSVFVEINPREKLGIREFVLNQVDNSSMYLENGTIAGASPYMKALDWLVLRDPKNVTLAYPTILQRFILAYMYYTTSHMHPWAYCVSEYETFSHFSVYNSTESSVDNQSDHLDNQLKTDTKINSPCFPRSVYSREDDATISYKQASKKWLSEDDECKWMGVRCDVFGHVVEVELLQLNMTGSFPHGIYHIPFLFNLGLVRGELSGVLHEQAFAKFKHLSYIQLQDNAFTGPFPGEIFRARNLRSIRLFQNQLTGTLPQDKDLMKNIVTLYLGSNRISGSIPSHLMEILHLRYFKMQGNMLSGTIPTQIGMPQYLQYFDASNNRLVGSIPEEVGNAPILEQFSVAKNKISGRIPESLYNATKLTVLDVADNLLNGTISTQIGLLDSLYMLLLRGNKLTGTIPVELGNVTNVIKKIITLDDNDLVGSIPIEVCELSIITLEADCLPDPTTGVTELECPKGCCTTCCNSDATVCSLM